MSKRLAALIAAAILPALASALPAQARAVQTASGRQLLAPAAQAPHHHRFGSFGSALVGSRAWAVAGGHYPARVGRAGFSGWGQHRFGSFGSALVGSAPVQPGPASVAVDRATDTIYVASGTNDNGPVSPGGDTVSVIDGRRCQARNVSKCKGPWPTVKVGNFPTTIAVDQATDTVYVTVLSGNTVAVFNGATCNGQVAWGCHRPPAHVRVGPGPFGIFADDENHTVYVANPGLAFNKNTISMINTRTCNGSDLAGCTKQKPPTVPIADGPSDFGVNQATHAMYVAAVPGVAALDARTCNATVLTGCGHVGMLPAPPSAPAGMNAVSVDSANNTIYAAPVPSAVPGNTISAFDGRACEAEDLTGCATAKTGTVTVAPPDFFEVAFWLVLDAPLHTVYVVNQKDDTLSAVNTNVCNGRHLAACATLRPPTIHTGEDPESVAVNTGTQTLYTANQVDNTVSVIDAARCNATNTRGCRQPPPALTLPGPGALTADPATGTLYVPTGTHTVAMINTRACNARHHSCTPAPPTVTVGAFPAGIAVNQLTHTVYIANSGAGKTGTITVLDQRACNATTTSGCTDARTLHVTGGSPAAIAVNPATDTVYVATVPRSAGRPGALSVFNGATCNADSATGCGQAPHTAPVGFDPLALAVNPATDTIYVANFNQKNNFFAGNTVSVVDGATCNATETTGCGTSPQTITLGPAFTSPIGVIVNQAADTIYVANLENGEGSGTVSVINGATCDATITTGCGQHPSAVTVGFGPSAIAFDPAHHTVAVTNIEDTSVSVINAVTCNATVTIGCQRAQPRFPAGRAPGSVAIDPTVGTIYSSNGDNTVSIIPETR